MALLSYCFKDVSTPVILKFIPAISAFILNARLIHSTAYLTHHLGGQFISQSDLLRSLFPRPAPSRVYPHHRIQRASWCHHVFISRNIILPDAQSKYLPSSLTILLGFYFKSVPLANFGGSFSKAHPKSKHLHQSHYHHGSPSLQHLLAGLVSYFVKGSPASDCACSPVCSQENQHVLLLNKSDCVIPLIKAVKWVPISFRGKTMVTTMV